MKNICAKTHLVEFDYIRVLAMVGILICHSCYVSSEPDITGFGRYLGATVNFLFLILSAFLLGLSWRNKGYAAYGFGFVSKRVKKLSKSYYPYLVMLFAFLYLSEGYVDWKNVVSHLLFLPWFDKMDGFGHLWFLTMIVICYTACWSLSNLSFKCNGVNTLIYSLLIGGGIALGYLIDSLGLPGYIVPYLLGYLWVFRHSGEILSGITKLPVVFNVLQVIVINAVSVILFKNGIFDSNRFLSYFLGMLSAISIFCLFYGVLRNSRRVRIIEWFSAISFEIYLAHEFFLGRYCAYTIVDSPVIGFFLLVLFSTLTAIVIKYTWPVISKCISHLSPTKQIDKAIY